MKFIERHIQLIVLLVFVLVMSGTAAVLWRQPADSGETPLQNSKAQEHSCAQEKMESGCCQKDAQKAEPMHKCPHDDGLASSHVHQ